MKRGVPPATTPAVNAPVRTAPLALPAQAGAAPLSLTPVLSLPQASVSAAAAPQPTVVGAGPSASGVSEAGARASVQVTVSAPPASVFHIDAGRASAEISLPAAAVAGAVPGASAQPAPSGLEPILRPDGQASRPGTPLAAAGAQIAGRLAAADSQPQGLDASFKELEHLFDGKRDEPSEGNSVVPDRQRRLLAGKIRARFNQQITAMEKISPEEKALLEQVRTEGNLLIDEISGLMAKGEIDPRADIRTSRQDQPGTVEPRELRVGFYAVAADPFQWAHLLIGLRAMAAFRLDKIVFVLAGDDPRKPNLTPASFRHPMGRAVLDTFAPLFEFSSIADGTTFDGETNIFRMLALNKKQRMRAFYIVGGDHYKLKDKNGGDDTLPKLEKKLKDPSAGHNPELHAVEAAFIAREGMDENVPTTLPVHFLPMMSFDASSTLVRRGKFALMPYAAYEFVRQRRPGLYGIGKPAE